MSKSSALAKYEKNIKEISEAFHLHACRPGPLNANEIHLAISESCHRPYLKKIWGITQPKGIVAKYLWYWTSGLPEKLTNFLVNNLYLSGEKIYSNGSFNQKVICTPSDEIRVSKTNLIDSIVVPLLDYYSGSMQDFNLPRIDIDTISESLDKHPSLNLQNGLRDISCVIANALLKSKNLPTYSVEDLAEETLCKSKTFNHHLLEESYYRLIDKNSRRYRSINGTILNELKTYNGKRPNENQIKKILARSRHKNPLLKELEVTENTLLKIMQDPLWIPQLSLEEIFEIAITAHSDSIEKYVDGQTPYIDGKAMVDATFKLAASRNIAIILQEFNRTDNYEIYEENIRNYPNLTILAPVCKTWDLKEFPEYDQNLMVALKYLATN